MGTYISFVRRQTAMLFLSKCFFNFWFLFLIQGTKAEEQKPGNCIQACPDNWEKKDERCYLWQNDPKTWAEAEEFCNEKEAYLASVTSQNIHDYIWSKIEPTGSSFWIGGSDQEEEGIWKWSDGSKWNFTQWLTNEPNNHLDNENCVQFGLHRWAQNGWNDEKCDFKQRFVCSIQMCSEPSVNISNNNNGNTTSSNTFPVLAVILPVGIIFIVATIAVIIFVRCQRFKKKDEDINPDMNPVYGTYQLG